MLLIIVWHMVVHGIYATTMPAAILPVAWTTWHVDAFVALSGWFGIRLSSWRLARFVSLIVFYAIVFCILGNNRLSAGWFGANYLALMLFSPMLNLVAEHIARMPTRKCLCLWSLPFAVFVVKWLPGFNRFFDCSIPGVESHGLLTMMFVYGTARIVRVKSVRWHVSVRRMLLLGLGLLTVQSCCIALGWGTAADPYDIFSVCKYVCYHSPVIMLEAIWIVVMVSYIRFPAIVNRFGSWIAPSVFSMYLIHDVCGYSKVLYYKFQVLLCDWSLPALLVLSVSAVAVFCGALLVDVIRRIIMRPVTIWTKPLAERLNNTQYFKV